MTRTERDTRRTGPERPPAEDPHRAGHGEGLRAVCACAHAHDHARRAPEALAEAEERCRQSGVRLTPIRRQVLEALYRTHRPMSAYDLTARIADGERPLSAVSVYRALEFLMANGFAHRLESRNAFVACPASHGPGELVVFMICDGCGGVDEVVSEDLSGALSRVAGEHGFVPYARVIELAGRCEHCRSD